jgi:hypothetical protein
MPSNAGTPLAEKVKRKTSNGRRASASGLPIRVAVSPPVAIHLKWKQWRSLMVYVLEDCIILGKVEHRDVWGDWAAYGCTLELDDTPLGNHKSQGGAKKLVEKWAADRQQKAAGA